jgi:hypothetical protein
VEWEMGNWAKNDKMKYDKMKEANRDGIWNGLFWEGAGGLRVPR